MLDTLEQMLGYRFRDRSLLEGALCHSSYANENRERGLSSNERLEFLGDAVLGMIVGEALFRAHPEMPEGELTRTRAALVCEGSLVQVADAWNLGEHLKLGKGEEMGGGRQRPSIRADAVEAVLAAVYLDGGIGSVRRIINQYILSRSAAETAPELDFKTALQELVQQESGRVLTYRLAGESGPDHDKRFCEEVLLDGEVIGAGEGRSKKQAEQNAARKAIETLKK